jgi:hypothetical protein
MRHNRILQRLLSCRRAGFSSEQVRLKRIYGKPTSPDKAVKYGTPPCNCRSDHQLARDVFTVERSAAMLRLYCGTTDGIAVQTTFAELRDSIVDADVCVTLVRYVLRLAAPLPMSQLLVLNANRAANCACRCGAPVRPRFAVGKITLADRASTE